MFANFFKRIAGLFILGCLAGLLAACGESLPPTVAPPTPISTPTSAPPSPTARLTNAPPTTEASALLPTATSPVTVATTPTPFPTPTPRLTAAPVELGTSLVAIRTTKVSFQTAYAKASARMNGVNNAARLVQAQLTTFTRERTVWTFVFTLPKGNRSWTVYYDSAGTPDKKELLSLNERSYPLLPEEAGQIQISKVLDSDEISTRLERNGIPPELPLDTLFLQMVVVQGQGNLAAYIYVNGPLNKQIIVNAASGQVIKNDFI